MPKKPFSGISALLLFIAGIILAAGAGIFYWQSSGRVSFEGTLAGNTLDLAPHSGGRVASIEASPGQRVRAGQVLLRFAAGQQRRSFEEEQRKLKQLAVTLPPEFIYLQGPDGRMENLVQRAERQRSDERQLELALHEATDRHAEASVTYSRATMLTARNKLAPNQRDSAENALKQAEAQTREAKSRFEQASLQRSETDKEIRRLRDYQTKTGADRIPVQERLAAYEQQQARLRDLTAALEPAVLTAPADGTVLQVRARPGEDLPAASAAIIFAPDQALPVIKARLPESDLRKLAKGQRCVLSFPGVKQGETPAYIAALASSGADAGSGQSEAEIQVALLPNGQGGHRAMPSGADAVDVTVFLRKPPYSPSGNQNMPDAAALLEEAAGPAARSADAPEARAVPPESPLSVQTPFGHDGAQAPAPPTVKAGSPAAAGQAPVPPALQKEEAAPLQLPPMKAPYPLQGSPLPDPRNNPSIVPSQTLDPPHTRP